MLDKQLLLSAYHYTDSPNVKNIPNVGKIISEKVLINIDQVDMTPSSLFVPTWADKNIKAVQKILVPIKTPERKHAIFKREESTGIINELCSYLIDKYGVTIHYYNNINDERVAKIPGISEKTAAFIYNGEIFLNTEKATIEEPLHEFLHLVLITLKGKDPDKYYMLINSVADHSKFNEVSKLYEGEINSELLEETFIKLLTETFKRNIKSEGIYETPIFNILLNESIQSFLHLEELPNDDAIRLLNNSINEIMTEFGTSILNNSEDLIDNKNILEILGYSSVIKELLKSGQLTETCT